MSDNRRSLTAFTIVLVVLGLVVAAFSTAGFGLFAEEPYPPPPHQEPAAINLSCPEWRTGAMPAVLGRIQPEPGGVDFHGSSIVSCIAGGYDETNERISMVSIELETHASFTPEEITDRTRVAVAAWCGGEFQPDPGVPHSGSCVSNADTRYARAGWTGLKDLISVVVEIHYTDPAHLKSLADAQSTTPDALLAATAAQVGQAVLAGL